jgi:hypothetical protein
MNGQHIKVEYRDVTSEGPTLHLAIPSNHLLNELIGMFRRLSEGEAILIASDLPFFSLDNVREIEFVSISECKEPPRRMQPDKSREFFRWIHDSEGWIWCAKLAEGLTQPGHQYFDHGENNDVGIDASLMEDPTAGHWRPAI